MAWRGRRACRRRPCAARLNSNNAKFGGIEPAQSATVVNFHPSMGGWHVPRLAEIKGYQCTNDLHA